MSATPRTKEQGLAYRTGDGSEIVHASFAAALEIELADSKAECDRTRIRLASLFWSGALDKHTGGDVQRWAEEYTSELARLRAENEDLATRAGLRLSAVDYEKLNAESFKARAENAEVELARLRVQVGDYIKIIAEVLKCEPRRYGGTQ